MMSVNFWKLAIKILNEVCKRIFSTTNIFLVQNFLSDNLVNSIEASHTSKVLVVEFLVMLGKERN